MYFFIIQLFQHEHLAVLDPMDAFVDNGIVDRSEITEQVHPGINNYGFCWNMDNYVLVMFDIVHFRICFQKEELSKNGPFFIDTMRQNRKPQTIG